MCMGWGWSAFFCQAAVEHIVGEQRACREKRPAPRLDAKDAVTATCLDNAMLIHAVPGRCRAERTALEDRAATAGLALHKTIVGENELENLGAIFTARGRCLRHKPSRVWRLRLATQALMHRKVILGRVMKVWLGHVVHAFMLVRPGLSCLRACHAFAQQHAESRPASCDLAECAA